MERQLIRDAELKRPRPVSDLDLPPRIVNALLRQGIRTIGQLITRSREDLLSEVRGLGSTAALSIVDALAGDGLALADDAGETRYPRKTRQHVLNHYAWLDPVPLAPSFGLPDHQRVPLPVKPPSTAGTATTLPMPYSSEIQ